ncbi:MAG: TRCF domain-containing protein [Bacteriovoracaceae bacterium]
MEDFYIGKYKILVSTTIIESGIDIANANTLIVNRTNTFGLSQLHQLRGRIGRSDRKAYAYFVIPKFGELSEISKKRLESLQTHAEIGSGFSIANSDLEIRGAGDILGAEQSGHIENIGLELYMQLLEEAIFELKGEKRIINHNIEISIPEPAYIPNNYIDDSGTRLKYYKQLSNCNSFEELANIKDSLIDIFGPFGDEIKNLFYILETRIYLLKTGIKSVKLSSQSISIKFDKKILDENEQLKSKVISMFVNRPKVYQITPDYSVIYKPKNGANKKELLDFSKLIAEEIVPC